MHLSYRSSRICTKKWEQNVPKYAPHGCTFQNIHQSYAVCSRISTFNEEVHKLKKLQRASCSYFRMCTSSIRCISWEQAGTRVTNTSVYAPKKDERCINWKRCNTVLGEVYKLELVRLSRDHRWTRCIFWGVQLALERGAYFEDPLRPGCIYWNPVTRAVTRSAYFKTPQSKVHILITTTRFLTRCIRECPISRQVHKLSAVTRRVHRVRTTKG